MKALEAIKQYKAGDRSVLKNETWLKHLVLTKENRVNMEHIKSLSQLEQNQTFVYVEKTLHELENIQCSSKTKYLVEEVLKWSEVAKAGMPSVRKKWQGEGINLFAHNEASAQIFWNEKQDIVVYTLIMTHGLIGQYIRGEVSLAENIAITELVENARITKEELKEILIVLNQCIITGVSKTLWENIKEETMNIIDDIVLNRYQKRSLKETLKRLRTQSIKDGENYDVEYEKYMSEKTKNVLEGMFFQKQLWYIEPALREFTFEEFIKIFLLIHRDVKKALHRNRHVSLEKFMEQLYYDHKGEKRVNIYKKRIIEKYLKDYSIDEILDEVKKENDHVEHKTTIENQTILFDFKFSSVGEKLIDFCVEAEKSNVMHEQAIVLLFDFFGLRRDQYDRFYNEEKYLSDMNASGDFKKVIADYVVGENVIDIGPGGGVMLDMIEDRYPEKKVYGIDISQNVIDVLEKKKQTENRNWNVLKGDALTLENYFEKESVNTIIYSSIIHELFSYIPYNGERFNHETIEVALKSAFDVLKSGGRIIIRDGIMSEPVHEMRVISFKNEHDMEILKRYSNDFKGRKIKFEQINEKTVKMPVNDAMEFLYTYTWGEESYVHEINEQFGYFTPSDYKHFIENALGNKAKIVVFNHYLQEGYSEHLLKKIDIYNEKGETVELPDSTCFIVIEKQ